MYGYEENNDNTDVLIVCKSHSATAYILSSPVHLVAWWACTHIAVT